MDSAFERLRYMIKRLPKQLKPKEIVISTKNNETLILVKSCSVCFENILNNKLCLSNLSRNILQKLLLSICFAIEKG